MDADVGGVGAAETDGAVAMAPNRLAGEGMPGYAPNAAAGEKGAAKGEGREGLLRKRDSRPVGRPKQTSNYQCTRMILFKLYLTLFSFQNFRQSLAIINRIKLQELLSSDRRKLNSIVKCFKLLGSIILMRGLIMLYSKGVHRSIMLHYICVLSAI